MARLGDVFTLIRNGASIKQTEGAGGIPITRIETISNRDINRNKMGYAGISDIRKYNDYILQDNDILMSHINSEKHLGKAAIYHKENNEKIIHGMNLLMLRANVAVVLPQYAIHYFETPLFKQQIVPITKKSVNQASFTVTALRDIEIPLPELATQEYIASIFDKLTDLISLRKQQLAKLDELVKARFVEMFGDPVANPMNWAKSPLGKECSIITGNTPPRNVPEYYGDYIEWIKSDNINTPQAVLTAAEESLSKQGLSVGRAVDSGSILMTCIAGSVGCIGNVAIADRKVAFNQQINGIIPNSNNVWFMYVQFELSKKAIQSSINMVLKGILSKGQLSEMKFIFPPINLQNEYGYFATQIDKSRLTIQQSLDRLELLKKALMQEYFG